MEKEEINRLERLAEEQSKCPYIEPCCESNYAQCYNHSHVLCKIFESFYESNKRQIKR